MHLKSLSQFAEVSHRGRNRLVNLREKKIYPFVSSGRQRPMSCIFYTGQTGAILCSVVVSYQDDGRRRRQL